MKIRRKNIQGWQWSCWGFLKSRNMENQLTCFVSKQRTSYYNSDTTDIVLLSRHIKGTVCQFQTPHTHFTLVRILFSSPCQRVLCFQILLQRRNNLKFWFFQTNKKSNMHFPFNRFQRVLSHTCIIFKNRNVFKIIYPRLLSIRLSQTGKSQTVPKASSVLQIMNFPPCNMSVKYVYLFLQSEL